MSGDKSKPEDIEDKELDKAQGAGPSAPATDPKKDPADTGANVFWGEDDM